MSTQQIHRITPDNPPPPTDTPLTDAAEFCVKSQGTPVPDVVVHSSFARRLERENARLREALEEIREPLSAYVHGDIELLPQQINNMLDVVDRANAALTKEAQP